MSVTAESTTDAAATTSSTSYNQPLSCTIPIYTQQHEPERKWSSSSGTNNSIFIDNEKIMATCLTIIGDVPLDLMVVVVVWYCIGVASICTTKILADQGVPPLVLTFQQLFLSSVVLRIHLGMTGELQPLPKVVLNKFQTTLRCRRPIREIKEDNNNITISNSNSNSEDEGVENNTIGTRITSSPSKKLTYTGRIPSNDALYIHFGLMGVFDGLDFLSTAIGFSLANASFVETVKSIQPITTTAVALFFGIDTLQRSEAVAMAVIITGVFCATLGNVEGQNDDNMEEDPSVSLPLHSSGMTMAQCLQTLMIGVTANLMFALRVNSQKTFRAHPEGRKMNDTNMLMWMQRMGSLALSIPVTIWELPGVIQRTRETPFYDQLVPFWILVLINAVCFSLYTLTNTSVLTKVSVGQNTGLNALRRMFVIVYTAIAFGVPITPMKAIGIVLCFSGFSAFSFYRHHQHVVALTTKTTTTTTVVDKDVGCNHNSEDSHNMNPMIKPLLMDPSVCYDNNDDEQHQVIGKFDCEVPFTSFSSHV
jgi:drug/metabolite transporter (DMT)-like permease